MTKAGPPPPGTPTPSIPNPGAPTPLLHPPDYAPIAPRFTSYLLELAGDKWRKHNTKPYIPDPLPAENDPDAYHIVKPGQRWLNGKEFNDPAQWFIECEPKWKIDHEKLLVLPQPWIILQGYWPLDDHDFSLRIIPARMLAFIRLKSLDKGCRDKLSYRVPYEVGRHLIMYAPGIAYKYRFIKRDDTERAWLVDYFPEYDHWQAETELPDPDCAVHQPHSLEIKRVPDWCVRDVTQDEWFYTRSRAVPRSFDVFKKLMHEAEEYGSQEEYEPGDNDFNWQGKIGDDAKPENA